MAANRAIRILSAAGLAMLVVATTAAAQSVSGIPNHELKQLLLSYGDGLEILSPKSFRVEIFNTITRMNKKYNKTETLSGILIFPQKKKV